LSGLSETAYAKINLALHVRERFPDGYHRIETVFAFCEDGDQLSAEHSAETSLKISGEFAGGLSRTDNLVLKAAAVLREATGGGEPAALHLHKALPVAAGLGGGSADAAAALRLLSRLWNLPRPIEKLEEIARTLGADVAACVRSQGARGTARGDILEAIDTGLSGTPVLLINPRVELRTADVFARWDGYDRGELEGWRDGRNDLEAAAVSMVPQIGSILAWLSAQAGASCVRMSGSGATCFALFDSEQALDHAAIAVPREWWRLTTRLR
jgi:4-diphosphocytidyl-2-C-methyl-D-erythritol kinase